MTSYVLDGQQRITSLYAVRKGVIFDKEGGARDDYREISIILTPDYSIGDESIVIDSNPDELNVISVFDLFNSTPNDILRKFGEGLFEKIYEYKHRLESYVFSMITIGNKISIDIATDIFTRINTGGTTLTLFEIMVAKTYSEKYQFDLSEKYIELIHGNDGQNRCLKDASYETIPRARIL